MEQEFGKCPICGREDSLDRTYFVYNIPCECCGCKRDGKNMHFEMISHCANCVPDIPVTIKPTLKSPIDNKEYRIEIKGMIPYEINGQFVINHDLTKDHIK